VKSGYEKNMSVTG